MKHPRDEELSLSLALSADSAAAPPSGKKARRRPASSGDGEFVCKTCSRAFASFQALGGHRTSHMRGRHGLALGVGTEKPKKARTGYECHVCGLGFQMAQALGGHMRRHHDKARDGADDWVRLSLGPSAQALGSQTPPVLLELFA